MTTIETPITGTYEIDPVHSTIGFSVLHQGAARYRNRFTSVEGKLVEDDGRLSLDGSVPVESIDIHSPQGFREHVLASDFLEAAVHPRMTFASDDVALADGRATVTGVLTIKGHPLPITALGTYDGPYDNGSGTGLALALHARIDRRDAGIDWQMSLPGGRLAVAWDVDLEIDLSVRSVKA